MLRLAVMGAVLGWCGVGAGGALAASVSLCVPSVSGQAVKSGACAAGAGTTVALPTSAADQQTLISILPHLSFIASGIDAKPTIRFSGVNVQIVDGSGHTTSVNGTGNLVLGYDETPGSQTGSHDLILGEKQAYTSYGSILGGYGNDVSGAYATALGGYGNVVSSAYSSVLGGCSNLVGTGTVSLSGVCSNTTSDNHDFASISGGAGNQATGISSALSGGQDNLASGSFAGVSGGAHNIAADTYALVAGGCGNVAGSGPIAFCDVGYGIKQGAEAVLGGNGNEANGEFPSVAGGTNNNSFGNSSTIAGGESNTSSSFVSSVGGGYLNNSGSGGSSIAGGEGNIASDQYSSIAGGCDNLASATATPGTPVKCSTGGVEAIFGGEYNVARLPLSSIAGGCLNLTGSGSALTTAGCDTTGEQAILGGAQNIALGLQSSISGGFDNGTVNEGTSILGGNRNIANASNCQTIPAAPNDTC
jgi:hypothetical protein